MNSVRQRNMRHDHDEKQRPLVQHSSPRIPQRTRHQHIKQSPRTLNITIAVLILAALLLYHSNEKGKRRSRDVIWTPEVKTPSGQIAICSREGKKIYTVPEVGGIGAAECVVVGDKIVVDHGSLASIRRRWSETNDGGFSEKSRDQKLRILYLPAGYTMTPGLIDSHAHPLAYGYFSQLSLVGSNSIDEVVTRVEQFVRNQAGSLPAGAWVEGMGWDQNKWEVKEFPKAADLEASPILRGLPIALSRIDVHAEWVSPAVMKMLGPLPEKVEGGQIVRDAEGQPTGVFVDNAIELINAVRPPWSDAQREKFLNRMTQDALGKGMTSVHDARVPLEDLAFFKHMAEAGKLNMRFYSMLHCGDTADYCGDQVERFEGLGDGRLTLRAVKLFGDGALGSRGAAMLEDYSDQLGWKGFLLRKEEEWRPLIKKWHDEGWQVNVHTIGDKANKVAIDAFEHAVGGDSAIIKARRHRLEHAQIMRPVDLEKAAKLGLIASYQPTHATSDMWYAEERLGVDRLRGAYAWQSYLKHGGRIALGSDFPVESVDPLLGFYAAVTRLSEQGTSPNGEDGWIPEEKLTREQALRGLTVDGAYASFSNITGSLTVGKRFDAVVWDDDLMVVDVKELLDVRVKATILDGQVVWGNLRLDESRS